MTIRFETESEYQAFLAKRDSGSMKQNATRAVKPVEPVAPDAVSYHCQLLGLPKPEREFYFAKPRKYRFDWAFPTLMIALEKEGIVYPKAGTNDHRLSGRHTSVSGFREDIAKYALGFTLGWTILRALPEHIDSGEAVQWIHERVRKGVK